MYKEYRNSIYIDADVKIAYDTFNGVKYDEVIKSYRTIDITHTNNVVLEYRIE